MQTVNATNYDDDNNILIDGLNASPLNNTSGLLEDSRDIAVIKRAAPPTGS